MDEIEDTLKQSPFYNSLPADEKKDLAEQIYRQYADEEKED
jgi:hypothetical protein